jgi:hypothetical protein
LAPKPATSLSEVKVAAPRWAEYASMTQATLRPSSLKHPFPVPARLSPDLERVEAYWRGLLRGGAQIPFWDDAKLTELPDLADRLVLLDVFSRPERFRFGVVGKALADGVGGLFLDEMEPRRPFEFLRSQCAASVECGAPTLYRHADDAYQRLILPMWGEGRISMLLGAIEFA